MITYHHKFSILGLIMMLELNLFTMDKMKKYVSAYVNYLSGWRLAVLCYRKKHLKQYRWKNMMECMNCYDVLCPVWLWYHQGRWGGRKGMQVKWVQDMFSLSRDQVSLVAQCFSMETVPCNQALLSKDIFTFIHFSASILLRLQLSGVCLFFFEWNCSKMYCSELALLLLLPRSAK